MSARPLNKIAEEIQADWINAPKGAADHVDAMRHLTSMRDAYGQDSAVEIVARFLSLANTWRGETARRVKAELNALLKAR